MHAHTESHGGYDPPGLCAGGDRRHRRAKPPCDRRATAAHCNRPFAVAASTTLHAPPTSVGSSSKERDAGVLSSMLSAFHLSTSGEAAGVAARTVTRKDGASDTIVELATRLQLMLLHEHVRPL